MTKRLVAWPSDEIGDLLGAAAKKRDLTVHDVAELLRLGRLRFVVANLGEALCVLPLDDCHDFWKRDAKRHICDTPQSFRLEDFEGGYCYLASEWDDGSDVPLVLLFKNH